MTVGLFTLVALLCSSEARPQDVANSLEALRDSGVLRPGDSVYVTDDHGQRTKGTLRDLVAASLKVTVGGETRDFSETNITKVERRDSIENGIWIGLATGVGITVVACKVDPDPEHCPYLVAYVGLPAIAAGTILGGVIDLLLRRTLYLTEQRITYALAGRFSAIDLRVWRKQHSKKSGSRGTERVSSPRSGPHGRLNLRADAAHRFSRQMTR